MSVVVFARGNACKSKLLADIMRGMNRINVLFVCSKNQWRSPTAEAIYRNDARLNVRSCGTTRSAVKTVTADDIRWADLVLVMEDKHRQRLLADFKFEETLKPIRVLDIPDDYPFMDPELIELIESATEPILTEMLA